MAFMTKAEFDALPGGDPPKNAESLRASARFYRDMETQAYRSASGADQASAPRYGFAADAFGCLADGKAIDPTLTLLRDKWLAYCTAQNSRVALAPKVKSGPRTGQSVIEHRYVSPGGFVIARTTHPERVPEGG
jgi:hypothetical protein